MSAQGGTLGRLGTAHVPIWPVATLLAAAIAGAIALSTLGRDAGVIAPVDEVTSPVVVNPGMWTLPAAEAFVESQVTFPRGLEHAGAYPADVTATIPVGLENPGAYGISQITEATVTYPRGLENPGAYVGKTSSPKADAHEPIVVNGTVCGQCR